MVEQFGHPGLQNGAHIQGVVKPQPAGVEHALGVETGAEMGLQSSQGRGVRHTDKLLEDRHRDLVPALGGNDEEHVAEAGLGIDQQAVHVEHDGTNLSGKSHALV